MSTPAIKSDLVFGWLAAQDLQDAIQIEQAGFPPEEAASLDAFKYRQSHAGDLFLGAYEPEASESHPLKLIGYICSTRSHSASLTHASMAAHSASLTHASMAAHDPAGVSVCVHSVCVAPEYRRRGVAGRLLDEYVRRLEARGTYERILLITHEEMMELYEKAGFELVGESAVVHGPRAWFEMRRVLVRGHHGE